MRGSWGGARVRSVWGVGRSDGCVWGVVGSVRTARETLAELKKQLRLHHGVVAGPGHQQWHAQPLKPPAAFLLPPH